MPSSAPIWAVYLMLGGGARRVEGVKQGREGVVNGIVGVVQSWVRGGGSGLLQRGIGVGCTRGMKVLSLFLGVWFDGHGGDKGSPFKVAAWMTVLPVISPPEGEPMKVGR